MSSLIVKLALGPVLKLSQLKGSPVWNIQAGTDSSG